MVFPPWCDLLFHSGPSILKHINLFPFLVICSICDMDSRCITKLFEFEISDVFESRYLCIYEMPNCSRYIVGSCVRELSLLCFTDMMLWWTSYQK